MCKHDPRPTQRGGITLYYLATQSSPEEAEDRWRYGCCARHHDPHSSPQRLLQSRLKKKTKKKHVSAQIVTETGSQHLLDQNRWISGPGLCGRWVCPTGCCSWWCPPSLQRTSSPQRSSTTISWKATWRRSEPGDGDLFTHFDTRNWKMIGWCLKQRTGKRAAVVSETKDRLLCRRRGWEVEAPLGKWWAAGFSCHLAAVWCHPGRIPPSLRHRTSQSARKQTKPLFNKNTSSLKASLQSLCL